MSEIETNAARSARGLRAIAHGLEVNPDLSVAQKVIRDAADKIEELERQRRELCENERDEAREQIKELIYIAERAIDLAEIDLENDKFGVVSQLRAGVEEIKRGRK
jgi:F0F1-type ATP synthase membrane subunit b/b'